MSFKTDTWLVQRCHLTISKIYTLLTEDIISRLLITICCWMGKQYDVFRSSNVINRIYKILLRLSLTYCLFLSSCMLQKQLRFAVFVFVTILYLTIECATSNVVLWVRNSHLNNDPSMYFRFTTINVKWRIASIKLYNNEFITFYYHKTSYDFSGQQCRDKKCYSEDAG